MWQMRTISRIAGVLIILLASTASTAGAQPAVGQAGHIFTLNDTQGTPYNLSAIKDHQMAVLYFFDAASRPSQEGLAYLNSLKKRFSAANLQIWAITMSPADAVARYIKQASPSFPVLLDPGAVSHQYDAKTILPTVCVMGPGHKIMDIFREAARRPKCYWSDLRSAPSAARNRSWPKPSVMR
jgi:peroxiredoxin